MITTSERRRNHKKTSCFKSADLFGNRFELGFESPTGTFQTKLGGIITILLGIVSLGILSHILSQYLDTESPIVTTSTEINAKNHTFNLYEDDLYLPLALSNAFRFIKDYERFITPKLRIYDLAFNPETDYYDVKILHEFDYKLCSTINDNKIQHVVNLTHPNKALHPYSLCPDFEGKENAFSIFGSPDNQVYRRAELLIYPCSLEDKELCVKSDSPELYALRLYYGKMNNLLTSADSKNPVNPAPSIGDIRLNHFFLKSMKFAVHWNKVIDYRYEFIPPIIKKEYSNFEISDPDVNPRDPSQMHCSKGLIALWARGSCREYLSMVYEVQSEVHVVRRNYKRFTVFIGELGGIMKLLSTVMFFLYSWYNKNYIKRFLADVSFGYNEKTKSFFQSFLEFDLNKNRDSGENASKHKPDSVCIAEIKCSSIDKIEIESQKGCQFSPSKVVQKPKQQPSKQCRSEPDHLILKEVEKRALAPDLIEKLGFLDFLQKIFLDENTKALLPLAMLKAEFTQKKKRSENREFNSKKITSLGSPRREQRSSNWSVFPYKSEKESIKNWKREKKMFDSNFEKERIDCPKLTQKLELKEEQNKSNNFGDSCSSIQDKAGKAVESKIIRRSKQSGYSGADVWSLVTAYQRLKKSKPKNSLKVKIKEFILEQISSYFNHISAENTSSIAQMSTEKELKSLKRNLDGHQEEDYRNKFPFKQSKLSAQNRSPQGQSPKKPKNSKSGRKSRRLKKKLKNIRFSEVPKKERIKVKRKEMIEFADSQRRGLQESEK